MARRKLSRDAHKVLKPLQNLEFQITVNYKITSFFVQLLSREHLKVNNLYSYKYLRMGELFLPIIPAKLEKVAPRKLFTLTPPSRATLKERMEEHKRVLSAMGVTDLNSLGTLEISGEVRPEAGVLTPLRQGALQPRHVDTPFHSTWRAKTGARPKVTTVRGRKVRSISMEKIGGTAKLLKAKRFPIRVTSSGRVFRQPARPRDIFDAPTTLPLNKAYWAATSIEIADDTTIILQQPHRFLVMIAPKINIGKNVTITWQQEIKRAPDPPQTPSPPPPAPNSTSKYAYHGEEGNEGSTGGPGPSGDLGPEIEIWTLNMEGDSPVIFVAGQDGFEGGRGGNGSRGGQGGGGRRRGEDCDPPAGNSGNGGKGGRAGDGGPGGNGGHGGRFSLLAPGETILRYAAQGFYIDASGGAPGRGGLPGDPGPGGHPGFYGGQPGDCEDDGHYGSTGRRGDEGSLGPDGDPGGHYSDALSLVPIDEETFWIAFEKPNIVTLSVPEAIEGDVVMAYGERFTRSDIVLVGEDPMVGSPTTVVSDTLLSFTVPATEGGSQPVRVRQEDGTLSNRATLIIMPVVNHAEQEQEGVVVRSTDPTPARFAPGSEVKLIGSGFAPDAFVQVLDEYVTGSDVQFIDPRTLVFKLVRPTSTPRAPDEGDATGDAGEAVEVRVVLATSETSDPITMKLDTFKMAVFGDSIMWGQGLQEPYKFHSLVEQYIRQNKSDIGVYKAVRAHSGAVIGKGDEGLKDPLHGEINTSCPTILQQVDAYEGDPKAVDLVLLNGGINDVNLGEIVDPTADSDLVVRVHERCYKRMRNLLTKVTGKFERAKVVVTGYYQIVSEDSDLTFLTYLLSYCLWFLGHIGWVVGMIVSDSMKDTMVQRSRIFVEEANAKIQMAVEEMNSHPPGVFFAKPLFVTAHAIFAPNSRLWRINSDLSPQDTPEAGGVAPVRIEQCANAPQDRLADGFFVCSRASVGHPNVRGAVQYALAIERLPII